MANWATRIPAAIKRAKQKIAGKHHIWLSRQRDFITATEVALAEALWKMWWYDDKAAGDDPPPALIAFTEKVEAIVG